MYRILPGFTGFFFVDFYPALRSEIVLNWLLRGLAWSHQVGSSLYWMLFFKKIISIAKGTDGQSVEFDTSLNQIERKKCDRSRSKSDPIRGIVRYGRTASLTQAAVAGRSSQSASTVSVCVRAASVRVSFLSFFFLRHRFPKLGPKTQKKKQVR